MASWRLDAKETVSVASRVIDKVPEINPTILSYRRRLFPQND